MKNKSILITYLLFTAFIGLTTLMSATPVEAAQLTSVQSARLASTSGSVVSDNREAILRAFLKKYNSPLVDSAGTFIEEADKNNLDWKLVVSIAGVESWFGQRIPYNSYNGWGWGVYGDNVIRFNSWDEGIKTISKDLRVKYMEKWGAKDVYEIGQIYAADPNWANKVTSFMNKIEAFAEKSEQTTLSISI